MQTGPSVLIDRKDSPTFFFQAVKKFDGVKVASSIEIGMPVPVEGFPDDFVSSIRIAGFTTVHARAMGAFSFQAFDLAMQMAKSILTSYDDEWDFYFSEAGPISFEY